MSRGAVFLDRDGTINVDVDHLSRAEDVRLLPGAAAAIRDLNLAQIPVIVVTNQSGIGRGLFTADDFEAVMNRVAVLLARQGARYDAVYLCPHAPDNACECRKPGTLLYRDAAGEHGLDVTQSFYVGDRWRDVAPGLALGGTGYLVPSPATPAEESAEAEKAGVIVPTLGEVVTRIIAANAAIRARAVPAPVPRSR